MPTHLPYLAVETRDFAIETARALNTVRRVPPSPPKQNHKQKLKPLPPRPLRPEVSAPQADVAAPEERQLTPPVPVKSPRRNVEAPELRAGESVGNGPAREERCQGPTGHAPTQQIALQQLPTSFYAPVRASAAPLTQSTQSVREREQRKKRHALWHKTRIFIRILVFLLLLVDMSMCLAVNPDDTLMVSVLLTLTPIVLIYTAADLMLLAYQQRGMPLCLHLIFDFVLAGGMMGVGVYETSVISAYGNRWEEVPVVEDGSYVYVGSERLEYKTRVAGIIGAMMICAGAMHGAVWIGDLVEVGAGMDG